jgi:YfaZ precursor
MLLRRIVALSLLAVSTTAMADTIDFNLRDTSAQFQYKSSMDRDALGKTEFHLGILYVNKNNLLSDFGVLVKDELGDNAPGFSVGVGIKGLVARVRGDNPTTSNASALALGGLVRYSPPPIPRLGIVGQVYLSPSIVTFGDADRYVEIGAQMEYEVIPQSAVYLGYRRIGFGLKAKPYTILDEGFHLGVRISF